MKNHKLRGGSAESVSGVDSFGVLCAEAGRIELSSNESSLVMLAEADPQLTAFSRELTGASPVICKDLMAAATP